MRYRKLTSDGDYSFGQGSANFWIDDAQCVAQSVMTRLLLWEGEWFLDQFEGTPWLQEIMGTRTNPTYDLAIQSRIIETPGVTKITGYASVLDREHRRLSVDASIETVFNPGQSIAFSISLSAPGG